MGTDETSALIRLGLLGVAFSGFTWLSVTWMVTSDAGAETRQLLEALVGRNRRRRIERWARLMPALAAASAVVVIIGLVLRISGT